MLTAAELTRYGRQIVLPEVGIEGQERLHRARVLIVGAGGLGSPAALYLAAAGVGTLGIVDNDRVEVSNLHRQILHATPDIDRDKTATAAASLRRLNPHVEVRTHQERLTPSRADALFADYDLIVDGCDNYATRYAVNDACARLGKVWVYGSVERFAGQVSVFGAPGGPCYRCVFPHPPEPGSTASCEEIGVLGAVPGAVGSLQATEALKWILGIGDPLVGRLLALDLRRMETRIIHVARRDDCEVCASASADTQGAPDGQPDAEDAWSDLEPTELAEKLHAAAALQLLDVREPWEWKIGRIGEPRLVPMNELPSTVGSLDGRRDIVVYCHHGVRSRMAAEWLRSQGFRARSLAGGIDRWSREIDSTVSLY